MKKFMDACMTVLREAWELYGPSGIKSATGINRQTFHAWMEGKQKPRSDLFGHVADMMGWRLVKIGMNSNESLQAENFVIQADNTVARPVDLSQFEAVPVVRDPDRLSHVRGDNFIEESNILYPAIIHKSTDVLGSSSANLVGVTVLESSIGTLIEKSDSLFFDREDRIVENGRVYLVRTPSGQTLIRRVIIASDGEHTRITFYSDNHDVEPLIYQLSDYEGDLDRAILGRGVWFRGNLREL